MSADIFSFARSIVSTIVSPWGLIGVTGGTAHITDVACRALNTVDYFNWFDVSNSPSCKTAAGIVTGTANVASAGATLTEVVNDVLQLPYARPVAVSLVVGGVALYVARKVTSVVNDWKKNNSECESLEALALKNRAEAIKIRLEAEMLTIELEEKRRIISQKN